MVALCGNGKREPNKTVLVIYVRQKIRIIVPKKKKTLSTSCTALTELLLPTKSEKIP